MQGTDQTNTPFSRGTAERVQFETVVEFKPAVERPYSGQCGDLSVGGIFLKTDYPFDPEETVSVSFSLPEKNKHKPISCKARVAWTNSKGDRRKPSYPTGVGLQFLNLSTAEASKLAQFIDAYDENKKMNVLCAWCGSDLGLRKGPIGVTSHGICNDCREKMNL